MYNQKLGRLLRTVTSVLVLALLCGCGSCDDSAGKGDPSSGPAIKTHPDHQTLPIGNTARFNVEAENPNGVTYQWQWSADGTTWNDIPGAVNSSYEIPAVTAGDNGWNQFRCVLRNRDGDSASNTASLTVVVVVYVQPSPVQPSDGKTWASAFGNPQTAINSAQPGAEIWVAAGTYKPTTGTDRTMSFVMAEGIDIYGGFVGTEECREARNRDANATILSGDIGVQGNDSDNCYHVVVGDDDVTLDGFTISGGRADDSSVPPRHFGGGMYNQNCSPTVTNCIFTGNYASMGGGMLNEGGSPVITDCTFYRNTGGGMVNYSNCTSKVTGCIFSENSGNLGGGICNYGQSDAVITRCTFSGNSGITGGGICNYMTSAPAITGCTFTNNSATNGGGLGNCDNSSAVVTNCRFITNTASGDGGGVYNNDGTLNITGCVFLANSSQHGGGMYSTALVPVNFFNCTFYGNAASVSGGAIQNSSNLNLVNCILHGNTAASGANINGSVITVTFSCIEGGFTGAGNTDANPGFTKDPSSGGDNKWGTGDDDYGDLRLQIGSPCIDRGNNSSVPTTVTTDFAGNPRISGVTVDMGAYEFQE